MAKASNSLDFIRLPHDTFRHGLCTNTHKRRSKIRTCIRIRNAISTIFFFCFSCECFHFRKITIWKHKGFAFNAFNLARHSFNLSVQVNLKLSVNGSQWYSEITESWKSIFEVRFKFCILSGIMFLLLRNFPLIHYFQMHLHDIFYHKIMLFCYLTRTGNPFPSIFPFPGCIFTREKNCFHAIIPRHVGILIEWHFVTGCVQLKFTRLHLVNKFVLRIYCSHVEIESNTKIR